MRPFDTSSEIIRHLRVHSFLRKPNISYLFWIYLFVKKNIDVKTFFIIMSEIYCVTIRKSWYIYRVIFCLCTLDLAFANKNLNITLMDAERFWHILLYDSFIVTKGDCLLPRVIYIEWPMIIMYYSRATSSVLAGRLSYTTSTGPAVNFYCL